MDLCVFSSEVGNAALKQTALSLFAKCNRGTTATENKFFWVLWSFLISSVIENLKPVSSQQTADLFPEHVPQGSFRLLFQCRILFFQCRKHSTVAATNSKLHVVNHPATRGYTAYHVVSAIKQLWRNEKGTLRRSHKLFIYFILTNCPC